jgi:2',3'-cyclic-nucleotide 2'-phosphodiesterase (5'-nucleotidase family)
VIAAGHTHAGLGHQVDGIGIIQPFSRGQSFGRADLVFDRTIRKVTRLQLFAPRLVCARQNPSAAGCADGDAGAAVEYEGRPVAPDPKIIAAMEPALRRVHELQASPIGITLDAPVRRIDDGRSPLGGFFADAMRAAVPGADVAAINNGARLWADLPSGPLTVGHLYDVFPFDNRLVRVSMSGADLSRWLANEIRQGRGSGVGISGVDVNIKCLVDGVHVDLMRGTERIGDEARLIAVTIGGPTLNGNLASPDFLGSVGPVDNSPVVREVVEDWFRRVGKLPAEERRRLLAKRPVVDCPRP